MSEDGTRSNRTVDYLMPDRKHSSKQLERRGMKNSSACDYERQDVIFGMNAISHVPEPYLDPVLLIGGRRIVSTTFKWSYKIVADDRKLNNSLRNLEPCGMSEYIRDLAVTYNVTYVIYALVLGPRAICVSL